jgi:hypothetical protein
MLESDSEDKKDGTPRMDKAVLMNMLTKVNSSHSSPGDGPEALKAQDKLQEHRSVPADLHEKHVPEAK